MFDAGWLVPGWPPELGGRNAGPIETLVYMEELGQGRRAPHHQPAGPRASSPRRSSTTARPSRSSEYAMPILRGERTACLGMSEPGAGSDLAALGTRAVRDGDRYVVNGQKVWTSGANYAEFCFLFCRTDPDAPKHKGISILLVDMDTPGITVRPLPEIVRPRAPRPQRGVLRRRAWCPPRTSWACRTTAGRMANGSLAHERAMVWLDSGDAARGVARARCSDEAPALLAGLPPMERASRVDQVDAACPSTSRPPAASATAASPSS